MTKKLILILSILSFSLGNAQYDWAPGKIVFKDGSSIKGLVKIPMQRPGLISIGRTKVQYKKKRKSSKEKFGSDVVEEIIFGDVKFAVAIYKYVPIKKKKLVLMQQVVNGTVSLYTRTVLGADNTSSNGGGFLPASTFKTKSTTNYGANSQLLSGGNYEEAKRYYEKNSQFYFKRDSEPVAKLVAGPHCFSSFMYIAKKYFSDCKDIVEYLDNDLYDTTNLIDLVEDYNLLCE